MQNKKPTPGDAKLSMPLPRTRNEIAELIPHQGTMCLLETVESCDAGAIVCSTRSHCAPDNPLRSVRGSLSSLHAVHLCEYGAQAMAVHGGLLAQLAGVTAEPGLLVSLRDVKLMVDHVPTEGVLLVSARRLHVSEAGWQYEFEVRQETQPQLPSTVCVLASGRALVMRRHDS